MSDIRHTYVPSALADGRQFRENRTLLHTPTVGLRTLLQFVNEQLKKSYSGFVARNLLANLEHTQHFLSSRLAVQEAFRAYNGVPAYRDFIREQIGSITEAKRYNDLPETSKDNYIKPNYKLDMKRLHMNYEIPRGAWWDTSTGSSGNPTFWYRSQDEVKMSQQLLAHKARFIMKGREYDFIDCFALGPWATGMTAAAAVGADRNGTCHSVGASDLDFALKVIRQCRELNSEKPIVVGGYPPHMETLVQMAREQGVVLHDTPIICVVGGQAMSEKQRARIQAQPGCTNETTGFFEVFNFYGGSDIDVNIGMETLFHVALRQALEAHPEVAIELFGGSIPMIPTAVGYDPLMHHIEVNQDSELVYTEISGLRTSPRVRYNLGDKGTIRRMSEIRRAFEKCGVELPLADMNIAPVVFVWGRVEDGVTYQAANLAWENLEHALVSVGIKDELSGFGIIQYEEGEFIRTDFAVHIADDATHEEFVANGSEWLSKIISAMKEINHDFKFQVDIVEEDDELPRLRVFKDVSPMSAHVEANPHRKMKYVFLGSDAQAALGYESGGTLITTSVGTF